MTAPDDCSKHSWREFAASLRFLEAEGFIVRWTDAQGNEWVRIADGAENAKL
jgi:hypothetical protein